MKVVERREREGGEIRDGERKWCRRKMRDQRRRKKVLVVEARKLREKR